MSKNLEQELKAYVEEIKPDLWNRIESQLPQQEQAPNVTVVDFSNNNIAEEKRTESKVVKNHGLFLKKYAGVIAACVAVAILVPVFALNKGQEVAKDASVKNGVSSLVAGQAEEEYIFSAETVAGQMIYQFEASMVSITDDSVVLQVVDAGDSDFAIGEEISCVCSGFEFHDEEVYACQISIDEDGMYHVLSVKVIY